MKSYSPMSRVLSLLLIATLLAGCNSQTTQQPQPTAASPITATTIKQDNAKRIKATVTDVVDGDTIEIEMDGKTEKVRLLLVDTPETKHPHKPVQPFGPEASNYAKKQLQDRDVEVEIDVSARDKYGRLLAYIWVDGKLFNEELLREGLARVAYVYPPNVKYVDQFREVQAEAHKAERGIWSIENYATDEGFGENVEQPATKEKSDDEVYYKNCTEAREAGAAPISKGDAGYRAALDRNGDGVACE
ncbi:thermonuclease family protein [Paenibacillus sp. 481]|uniref:thermonuclease family protein n=1 Tax=Paenibacillus sp. 481 TaxID=2835869 RepID=UPI001E4AE38E|nr:thermonuclease family protein [Paenibacillus sp. 481]UHA74445.1 thermonuclease family protein [Paenibacillus sp. 481]